jgi:hypothetical protein
VRAGDQPQIGGRTPERARDTRRAHGSLVRAAARDRRIQSKRRCSARRRSRRSGRRAWISTSSSNASSACAASRQRAGRRPECGRAGGARVRGGCRCAAQSRRCRPVRAGTAPRDEPARRRDSHSSTTCRPRESRAAASNSACCSRIQPEIWRRFRDRGPGCPGSGLQSWRASSGTLAAQRCGALRRRVTGRLERRCAARRLEVPDLPISLSFRTASPRSNRFRVLLGLAWTPGVPVALPAIGCRDASDRWPAARAESSSAAAWRPGGRAEGLCRMTDAEG